jgi:hypothetical protein
MAILPLAAAVAQIVNKTVPSRQEGAIQELHALEDLLAKALKENEDMLASQIRKRMRDLRHKYPSID